MVLPTIGIILFNAVTILWAPPLGAMAREIDAWRGSILLIQPSQADGYAASFVEQAGEGIMEVNLAVANLSTTRTLLTKNIEHPMRSTAADMAKAF
jgi:hypothetical protein